MKKIIILLLLSTSLFSANAMTRDEVKAEFMASPYLRTLSDAMDRIKWPDSDTKPDQAFETLMAFAFADTTMTAEYMQQMLSGEFSTVIIDRFGVYLRNCIRHDLAVQMGINPSTIQYEL